MKKTLLLSLAFVGSTLAIGAAAVLFALQPPAPLQAAASEFTVRDVTIVNPGRIRASHQILAIRDGRIAQLDTDAGDELREANAYRGKYVVPGLIDMHGHLPPGNPLNLTSYTMLLNLAHGVTTVRDAADIDGTSLAAHRQAELDGYPGPHILTCNAFVSAGASKWANTIALQSPADADGAAARLKAAGAHCIKAYDGLTEPMVRALEVAANKYDLTMIGHVPYLLSYEQARIPDVQHLMGVPAPVEGKHRYLSDGWLEVTEARLREVVSVTREHAIANTPTLVLGQQLLLLENYEQVKDRPEWRLAPRLFRDVIWSPSIGIPAYRGMTPDDFSNLRAANEKKLLLTRMLYEAGAQLYLGTDTQQPFVIPGQSLHQEMRLFAQAGIPIASIWEMATRQAAIPLRIPNEGSIVANAPANFLIFRDDPTANLDALASLEAVVLDGRLYPKRAIDAKIAEHQARYNGFIFDRVSTLLAKSALRKVAANTH